MTVRSLSQAVAGDWDAFVAGMSREVREKVPTYVHLDDSEVRDNVGLIARVLLELLNGSAPTEDALAQLRSVGSQRARQGVELADLVAALQAAVTAGVRQMHRSAASAELAPGDLAPVLEAVSVGALRASSLVQQVLTEGWTEGRADKLADDSRKSVALVERVLRRSTQDWESVEGAVADLGASPADEWRLFVIGLSDGTDAGQIREAAHAVAESTGMLEGPLRLQPTPHAVLLAPGSGRAFTPSKVTPLLGDSQLAVVASPSPISLDALGSAYTSAHEGLTVLGAATWASRWVTTTEVMWWGLRAAIPEVRRLSAFDAGLGVVLSDPRCAELMAILDMLVASTLSLLRAAELLGYDEKTIRRHLDYVRSLTGLRWSDPHGRRLICDLIAFRLIAAHSPDYQAEDWGPAPAPRERNWRFEL